MTSQRVTCQWHHNESHVNDITTMRAHHTSCVMTHHTITPCDLWHHNISHVPMTSHHVPCDTTHVNDITTTSHTPWMRHEAHKWQHTMLKHVDTTCKTPANSRIINETWHTSMRTHQPHIYGVATLSRLLKIIRLFCRTVFFIGLFRKRDL